MKLEQLLMKPKEGEVKKPIKKIVNRNIQTNYLYRGNGLFWVYCFMCVYTVKMENLVGMSLTVAVITGGAKLHRE